jgi:hypothetical protein
VAELQNRSLLAPLLALLLIASCSGLSTLTSGSLQAAQQQWESSGPANYRIIFEMSGDRIESSQYDVTVRTGKVVQLLSNGKPVSPGGGSQDYSVDGLFHILDEEIDLAKKPEILGAPPGYASYPMARFDASTGRLLHFQRSVGGTKNSIEIVVKVFEVLGK